MKPLHALSFGVALAVAFSSPAGAKPPPDKSTVTPPSYYDANGKLVGPALLFTDEPSASAVLLRVGKGLFPVKLTVSDYLTNGAVWSLRFATNLHKIDFDQPNCTGTMYVGGAVAPGIQTVGGVARDSVTGKYTLYLGSASERVVHFASSYYDQGSTPEETICVTPDEPIERGSAPVTSTFDLSVYALPLFIR